MINITKLTTERMDMEKRTAGTDGNLAALTAKVGPKGQIVIPKDIRDMFSIEPGDTVLVLADRDKGIAVKPIKGNEQLFAQIFGGALSVGEEFSDK